MSAIRLLVLGAVRQHGRAHGYQVRNDLEYWGAHEWSNAKPGSIYHALKQMAKQGLLHAHEIAPSTAGGPPRTEYEITEPGTEECFAAAARGADLVRPEDGRQVGGDRLHRRPAARRGGGAPARSGSGASRRGGPRSPSTTCPRTAPNSSGHIGEIMNLWIHTADAEAEWTLGLIARIEGGAYTFAGEGEPFVGVLAEGEENPYASGERHPGDWR